MVIQNDSQELGQYTIQCIGARSDVLRWSVRMSGVNAPVNGCWCRPATGDLVTVYDDGTVIVRDLADGKERHGCRCRSRRSTTAARACRRTA